MKIFTNASDEAIGESLELANNEKAVLFDGLLICRGALLAKLLETFLRREPTCSRKSVKVGMSSPKAYLMMTDNVTL